MTGTGIVTYKDIELEIDYYTTPVIPARWYLDNGDPGYPEEGGEFTIEDVRVAGISIWNLLSNEQISEIEEAYCMQHADDDDNE